MKNLLVKELQLTLNPFFIIILPLTLSLLLFIPNWIFTLVFMYFFWVSIPNIFGLYQSQLDYPFMQLLPVSKRDIVITKTLSHYLLEVIHILLAVVFGLIHIAIYGSYNFFIPINPALFGIAFWMYGIFNIIVLPLYFRTAWRWGKPVIYGVIATLLFAGGLEYASVAIPVISDLLRSNDIVVQLVLLGSGIVGGVVLSAIATMRSIKNYEEIS